MIICLKTKPGDGKGQKKMSRRNKVRVLKYAHICDIYQSLRQCAMDTQCPLLSSVSFSLSSGTVLGTRSQCDSSVTYCNVTVYLCF